MNWADWTIIGIFSLSCVIGFIRGFVREALSLGIWLAAALVARLLGPKFEVLFANLIDTPSVRLLTAYAVLFVGTLIAGSIVAYLVGALIRATGLSGTDRLLGVLFGGARAFIIVVALIIFLPGMLPVENDKWWQESMLVPHFVSSEDAVKNLYANISGFLSSLFGSAAEASTSI